MTQLADFNRLMAGVAAGSEDAVWQLAETYTPYILRAVRLSLAPRLRQKLDSEDFAQTLWASILLKRADLSRLKTPEQLIAYLSRATKNKVIDKTRHYKSQKNDIDREERIKAQTRQAMGIREQPSGVLYSREPTPSTAASLRERWCAILSAASERDRQILRLRLQGCTFDVVSRRMHVNEATARRAMQQLIDQLSV